MSDLDLAPIVARARAATRGPWIVDHAGQNRRRTMIGAPDVGGHYVGFLDLDHITRNARDNAAFIAQARTDIPALVDEVRKLRYMLARVSGWREVYRISGDTYVSAAEWAALDRAMTDQCVHDDSDPECWHFGDRDGRDG